MRDDNFDELRKTLARAQEILEKADGDNSFRAATSSKDYVDPVVGQETPLDALVLIQGYGTMSRRHIIAEIRHRLTTILIQNKKGVYNALYGSGVLKAMLETEILHQGKEL